MPIQGPNPPGTFKLTSSRFFSAEGSHLACSLETSFFSSPASPGQEEKHLQYLNRT